VSGVGEVAALAVGDGDAQEGVLGNGAGEGGGGVGGS
jgi:hypothetical protein